MITAAEPNQFNRENRRTPDSHRISSMKDRATETNADEEEISLPLNIESTQRHAANHVIHISAFLIGVVCGFYVLFMIYYKCFMTDEAQKFLYFYYVTIVCCFITAALLMTITVSIIILLIRKSSKEVNYKLSIIIICVTSGFSFYLVYFICILYRDMIAPTCEEEISNEDLNKAFDNTIYKNLQNKCQYLCYTTVQSLYNKAKCKYDIKKQINIHEKFNGDYKTTLKKLCNGVHDDDIKYFFERARCGEYMILKAMDNPAFYDNYHREYRNTYLCCKTLLDNAFYNVFYETKNEYHKKYNMHNENVDLDSRSTEAPMDSEELGKLCQDNTD